jgi:hypothetical protein
MVESLSLLAFAQHNCRYRFRWVVGLVKNYVAERVGFEPTVRLPLHTLSKRAPSTTRTPLQIWQQRRSSRVASTLRRDDCMSCASEPQAFKRAKYSGFLRRRLGLRPGANIFGRSPALHLPVHVFAQLDVFKTAFVSHDASCVLSYSTTLVKMPSRSCVFR